MATSKNFLDDVARVASGAVSAVTGLKGDAESVLRRQVERLMADMDLVPREEFDAVKTMAAKARTEQEALEARVAKLETQLKTAKKPPRKSTAKASTKTQTSTD